VPRYLHDHGNFRPLGRMLERSLDLLTHQVSVALGLPINIAMRLVHLAAAALLGVVIVLLVEAATSDLPMQRRIPSAAAHLTPFAFGMLLVAAGSASTIVIFTDLYFVSTAIVLATALAVSRLDWLASQGLTTGSVLAAASAGIALASFNEVTSLAPPLAVTAVVLRGRYVLRLSWRELRNTRAARATGIGLVAFATVFIPLRAYIALHCAGGGCYSASEIALEAAFWPALGHRLLSWLPPLQWRVATASTEGHWYLTSNGVLLLQLMAILALAWVAGSRAAGAPQLRGGQLGMLGLLGGVILGLGASLAALSTLVQGGAANWAYGTGWRDTQIAAAGGTLLAVSAALAVATRRRTVGTYHVAALAFGTLACLALLANQTNASFDSKLGASALHNRIALSVTHGSNDAGSNALRCTLLEEFMALHPERADWHERLRVSLDASMQSRLGIDYCSGGTVR
jgi:hypothetical protein